MKIITWNTQGNALSEGKLKTILKYDPDVICLQECGNLFAVFGYDFERVRSSLYYKICSWGTQFRPMHYHVYYYSWRNASRCSMATLVKADYNVEKACLQYYDYSDYYADRRWLPDDIFDFFSEEGFDAPVYDSTGRRGLRAMLQVIVDLDGSDRDYISINNVHLPSGRPRYAMKVAKSFFRKCRHIHSYIIMIGDMNIPAFMWKKHYIPYNLHATNDATHDKGHVLDYLFTDFDAPSLIEVGNTSHHSDHFYVRYEF